MKRASLADIWNDPQSRTFAVLLFFIGAAVEVARVVRDTYFITTVGAASIPWAFVTFAAVMVCSSYLYAVASRKLDLKRLVVFIITLALVMLLGELALISQGVRGKPLAYTLFCTVEMMFLFVPMTVWAVANQSFKLEEGERILPRIATMGLCGTVIGAGVARLIVEHIGVANLLLVPCTCLIVALYIGSKLEQAGAWAPEQSAGGTIVSALKEPLVKTLVLLAVPMWVLVYMIEYTYFHTMEIVFASETELASFLSLFVAFTSCVSLIVQLWLTPFLIKRFGVARTSKLYPAALAVAGVLTLTYSLFPAEYHPKNQLSVVVSLVLIARLLDMSLFQSVYESTVQVLYYAVPLTLRTQARALVTGIVFPSSIACAGLLLVFFNGRAEPVHNIAFCSVALGFLVTVMAMDIPVDYLRSLLQHAAGNPDRTKDLLEEVSRLGVNEARYVVSGALSSAENKTAVIEAITMLGERFSPEFVAEIQNDLEEAEQL